MASPLRSVSPAQPLGSAVASPAVLVVSAESSRVCPAAMGRFYLSLRLGLGSGQPTSALPVPGAWGWMLSAQLWGKERSWGDFEGKEQAGRGTRGHIHPPEHTDEMLILFSQEPCCHPHPCANQSKLCSGFAAPRRHLERFPQPCRAVSQSPGAGLCRSLLQRRPRSPGRLEGTRSPSLSDFSTRLQGFLWVLVSCGLRQVLSEH